MNGKEIPKWASYLVTGLLAAAIALWQQALNDQSIRETGEAIGDEITHGMLEAAKMESETEMEEDL